MAGVNENLERLAALEATFQHIRSTLVDLLAEHHVYVSADSLLIAIRQRRHDEGGNYFVQILEPLRGTAVLLWTQTAGLRVLLQEFTVTPELHSSGVPLLGSPGIGSVRDEEPTDPTIRMGTPVALTSRAASSRPGLTGPIQTGLDWREQALRVAEQAGFLSRSTLLRSCGIDPAPPPSPASSETPPPPLPPPATPEPSPREQRILRL